MLELAQEASPRYVYSLDQVRAQAQIAMDSVMEDTPERKGARLVVRCYPVFKPATPREAKDTDFNDLHRLEGLAEVTTQMELTLDTIEELKRHG